MPQAAQHSSDDAPASRPIALRRLGLVVHPRRDLDGALGTAREWAQAHGAEVVQVRTAGQERVVADPANAEECDLVIALGGDGTTLAALHAAAPAGRAVLGIACGSLGALTATTADRLAVALDGVAAGKWTPRRLAGLDISTDAQERLLALNDLVVVRRGASQVVIAVYVDEQLYVRFAGDGIVVATPLGSSAYTMAAGGPVVAPGSDGMVVTPLAPHGGCCPPLVTGPGAELTLVIEAGYAGSRIEVDGRVQNREADRAVLRWTPDRATLVGLGGEEPLLVGLRRRRIILDSPRILARDERLARGQ
jgi:NAD+ kinase